MQAGGLATRVLTRASFTLEVRPLKAIQTLYRGYKFRSRLEARWGVFFDQLKIQWQYEPEGFELSDGSRYLPDFLLPDDGRYPDIWVEVKAPIAIPKYELRKVDEFARQIISERSMVGVLVVKGDPLMANGFLYGSFGGFTTKGPLVEGADRDGSFPNIFSCKAKMSVAQVREAAEYARAARFEHGARP